MKAIYEYYLDCGRMGSISSLFVADSETISEKLGSTVYFGEVLGKHSDISAPLNINDLTIKNNDPKFIAEFEKVFGPAFSIGHNPLHYIYDEEN